MVLYFLVFFIVCALGCAFSIWVALLNPSEFYGLSFLWFFSLCGNRLRSVFWSLSVCVRFYFFFWVQKLHVFFCSPNSWRNDFLPPPLFPRCSGVFSPFFFSPRLRLMTRSFDVWYSSSHPLQIETLFCWEPQGFSNFFFLLPFFFFQLQCWFFAFFWLLWFLVLVDVGPTFCFQDFSEFNLSLGFWFPF